MGQRSIQGRQRAFVEDLFVDNGLTAAELLSKHQVTSDDFQYWIRDKRFHKALKERIKWCHQQSRVYVAKYAVNAALQLIQLTQSKDEATSRRACLDILRFGGDERVVRYISQRLQGKNEEQKPIEPLDPVIAGKLLELVADSNSAATP